jgi:hypothetical protein
MTLDETWHQESAPPRWVAWRLIAAQRLRAEVEGTTLPSASKKDDHDA